MKKQPITIADWFNTIKDDTVRTMLFDNTPIERQNMASPNICHAFSKAFKWSKSPQGFAFWSAINNHFMVNTGGIKTYDDFKHLIPKTVPPYVPPAASTLIQVRVGLIKDIRTGYGFTCRDMEVIFNMESGRWSKLERGQHQSVNDQQDIVNATNVHVVADKIFKSPDAKVRLDKISSIKKFNQRWIDIENLDKLKKRLRLYH